VILNIRPTISRVISFVQDPNPSLGDVGSSVPQIQVREMDFAAAHQLRPDRRARRLIQDGVD